MPFKKIVSAKYLGVFIILFLVLTVGCPAVAPSYADNEAPPGAAPAKGQEQQPESVFTDLPTTYWAYDVIKKLYRFGITLGYPDNTIGPEEEITRAQFISTLVKALGMAQLTSGPPVFEDVPSSAWYYGFVQAAAKAGLVVGGEGKFYPDLPITRQEMFTMLVNSLKVKNTGTSVKKLYFTDVNQLAPWVQSYITRAADEGLAVGYPDLTLKPEVNATRAEAYAAIGRLVLQMLLPTVNCNVQQQVLQISGRNYQPGKYWLQIYDGKNNHVGTIGVSADSNGSFTTSYKLKGTEEEGTWRLDAAKQETPDQVEASSTFLVSLSSIPEFPIGAAGAVDAGICALIYYRMRKGKEALTA
ncbi:MAG: S-layer homology domain-containing protein [Firmicutes bacterium]|nr:S-layer homology domain-containing protein [Bacillota bacterium]